MTKREKVYNKFNGLCAYTGKPLGDDWQIDHVTSKNKHKWHCYNSYSTLDELKSKLKEVNNIDNLLPAIRIVNHYKRSLDLEAFRFYMSKFHKRLQKLPKRTCVERTQKRINYMYEVANLFDITPDKPFSGKFYFESLTVISTVVI